MNDLQTTRSTVMMHSDSLDSHIAELLLRLVLYTDRNPLMKKV